MFSDLSWSHMLLILVVALVVVGPQELPKLMRKMGQWTAKARDMADQFRRSFDDMARQSELDELRKELDELRNARPLAGVEQDLNTALHGPTVSLEAPAESAADSAPESATVSDPLIAAAPEATAPVEPAAPLEPVSHPPAP